MKIYSPWHHWHIFPDQNMEAMFESKTSGKKGTLSKEYYICSCSWRVKGVNDYQNCCSKSVKHLERNFFCMC